MNPEILLAGSIGAVLVFGLGAVRDLVRRRHERKGLMILISTEILNNNVVLQKWKDKPTLEFLMFGEIKSFRTEIWVSSRVRLAQILSPDDFAPVSVYYTTHQGIQDDISSGQLEEDFREYGSEHRRGELKRT